MLYIIFYKLVKLKLVVFSKRKMYTYFGTEVLYPATYTCVLHALKSDAYFFLTYGGPKIFCCKMP